jgi:hypothetical protein
MCPFSLTSIEHAGADPGGRTRGLAGNFSKIAVRGYGWAMKRGILRAVVVVAAGCVSPARTPDVRGSPAIDRLRLAEVAPSRDPSWTREGQIDLSQTGAKVSTREETDEAVELAEEPKEVPLPRLTSVSVVTNIFPGPGLKYGGNIGYLHQGSSIALRNRDPVRGRPDCPTAWYAVEPRGWICNDNTTVLQTERRILGENVDRLVRGLQAGASSDGPLPFGYAMSLGVPMYGRIPTAAEQNQNEWMYGAPGRPLGPWARGYDGLASGGSTEASPEIPWFLENGEFAPINVRGEGRLIRKVVPRGSMISFASAFEAGGRTWLLTPELAIVPADRVRLYRPSSFAGVKLDESLSLPIAWIRKTPRPKCRRASDGKIVPSGESWEARTAVGLTGGSITQNDRVFLATTEPNTFIAASDATVVEQSHERPEGVGPDEKWMQISIAKGTLTAYEGDLPVFSTLISPGKGGVPKYPNAGNKELVKHHNTPLGVYRIIFKDRFSYMLSDPEQKKFFISDVPYVQYFRGPFAIHAAFWHEAFGEPMSGGCINVSPQDAERLFAWTEPQLPASWQGVRSGPPNGRGTVLQILP